MTSTDRKELTLFDFSKPDDIAQWYSRDDSVMGGISDSQLRATDKGTAIFAGEVSLENNGGFAAVRSRDAQYNLSAYTGIMLRLKGDSNVYGINMRTSTSPNGLRYQANFKLAQREWMLVHLPFQNFAAASRGKRPPDAPPLDIQHISSFGIIISNKQVGPFLLEIEWIKAF